MPLPIIFFAGQALGFLARRAALLFAKKIVKKSATKSITKSVLKGLLKKTGKKIGVSAVLGKSISSLASKAEQDIDKESSIEKEDVDAVPMEDDKEKVAAEPEAYGPDAVKSTSTLSQKEPITGTKIDLLNRILSETFILRKTVKSIEEFYYQREQDVEAEAIERKSEEKDAERIDKPSKLSKKDKADNNNKRISVITAIAKAFLGVLISFGPILVRLFKDNKEMIMSLPSLLKDKFSKIGQALATAVDEYLIQPIKELFTVSIPELWNTLMETGKQFIDNLVSIPIRLFNGMKEYYKQLQVKALSSLYSVAEFLPLGLGKKVQSVISPYLKNKKKELQILREENRRMSRPKPKTSTPLSRKPPFTADRISPSATPDSSISKAIGASEAGGSYDIAFGDVVGRGGKIKNLKGVKTAQEFANKKLSEMTLEEILKFQNERDSKNKGTSAVGKYQFMKKTLFGYDLKGGLVKQAGLSMNDKFSPENQEKLQEVFLGQNSAILKKAGVPTSPGYLYMAHYIGPYGAIAVYNSSEKGEDITVAQALAKKGYADPSKHNPELAKIKVSQLEEILSGRMAKGGATESGIEATPEPQKEIPQIAAINPEEPDRTSVSKPAGGGSLTSVFGLQPGVDVSKIHPEFAKAVVAMGEDFFQKTGKKLIITSGYRSNEKQKQLFDAKVAELGGNVQVARKMVAEPMPPLGRGRGSFHIKGLALDISSKGASSINVLAGPRSKSTGWLESFGLTRPVPGEDWHIQPVSSPPTPDNPGAPGRPIQVANKDGNSVNLASGETKSKPNASKIASSLETGSAIAQSSMNAKVEPKAKMKNLVVPVQIAAANSKQNKTPSGKQGINSEGVLAEYRLMLGTA